MTLAEYREQSGVTQDELAERLGVRQSTVSKLELGKFSPSLLLVRKIYTLTGGAVRLEDWPGA